jgi:transcription antitermination protein NusB
MNLRKARHAARLGAVQALYQMELSGKPHNEVLAEFESFWLGQEVEGLVFDEADRVLFRDLVEGVVKDQRIIDKRLDEALKADWPLKRIEMVLRAILRVGSCELQQRKDVPAKAAISEYVTIARDFYGEDEPGLVNAVLDGVARQLRPKEFGDKSNTDAKKSDLQKTESETVP